MYLAAGEGIQPEGDRVWLLPVHLEGGRVWFQPVYLEGGRVWFQPVHLEGGRGRCLEGAGKVRTPVGDTDQLDTDIGPPDIELNDNNIVGFPISFR